MPRRGTKTQKTKQKTKNKKNETQTKVRMALLGGNFPAKFPRPEFPQEILARILLAEEILKPKISWRQEEILRGNFGIT